MVGRTLSHYKILDEISRGGGMGEVYKAKNLKLGRDLAIKVLRKEELGTKQGTLGTLGANHRQRSRCQEETKRLSTALSFYGVSMNHVLRERFSALRKETRNGDGIQEGAC